MSSRKHFPTAISTTVCRRALAALSLAICLPAFADGPTDNQSENVRPIPPAGIPVPDEIRASLNASRRALQERIDVLRLRKNPTVQQLLPDIEIFVRAVDQALRFNEFFTEGEFEGAQYLLQEGHERAAGLDQNDPYWTRQTGLVVRGYRSKLDDTVQPYGLVLPEESFPGGPPLRCDLWFHGRFEKAVELQFLLQRMKSRGEIAPPRTIVLHPFGRFSNAFKFAGEVDVWEALNHARANYSIDAEKIAVRGFSMGGAGAWHFAVHHPDQFFAANPGAGFSETPEFLRVFQGETLDPPPYERALWNWYDCPAWVGNLRMIPTVAYSGEDDRQKQAADVMAAACENLGFDLTHIIGPKTGHQIHPESRTEIERRLEAIARQNRDTPRHVQFTTWTLRYNACDWVRVHGLEAHWAAAEVDARLDRQGVVDVSLKNVTDVELDFPSGTFSHGRLDDLNDSRLRIGGTAADDRSPAQELRGLPKPQSDGSWRIRVHHADGEWKLGPLPGDGLRKRPGLQGPIDDAFMDSFLFVKPTGTARHPAVEEWVAKELDHAVRHWRQQMRGDARVKPDSEVSDEDVLRHHLVLWGDPASNAVLAKILDRLPVQWSAENLQAGSMTVSSATHVPVLIFPNPLNPDRYVVLNSSFTYREYDYLNNARQTPKLPDWAVIDITQAPGSRWPGKVVNAGFFDERWDWRPETVQTR